VEDDPALRMVMREVLKDDFEIDEADNGDDGIQKGLNNANDIIILDYHLPKKDGLEVIAAVRKANPGVPVIVLTGYLNPESEEQFNRLGANKIFPKPFNYKTLLETVRDLVLAKQQAVKIPTQLAAPSPKSLVAQAISTESEMLQQSLNALAGLAEKVEFLQSITEKYWIEPQDVSTIRETTRAMEIELRQFYGQINNTLFESGDLNSPLIRKADKPCLSGNN
ncbi:MAG: response regulator, partial [Verrucomicrobiota bacterium]